MGDRRFCQSPPEETAELTAFHRSFWCTCKLKGAACNCSSPVTDQDVVALIGRGGYGITDVGVMFGLSRERIRQIASRNGLSTAGTLPRIWDASLNRFRAMGRDEWRERKRIQAKARAHLQRLRRVENQAPERERHVRAAKRLAKELGRVPTLKEIGAAIGKPASNMIYFWGFRSNKVGEGTGGRASQRLYEAAGLQKRERGTRGHIVPGAAQGLRRKLTPEQVREIWESPHPYATAARLNVHGGSVATILQRHTYCDITDGWPDPAFISGHRGG